MSIFNFCLCSSAKKARLNKNYKHYEDIQKNLSHLEQGMLELIYYDLASRHQDNLLTFENFLLFFGLTGLWGAKLFRQFDESDRQLITKEQFFFGLSRTTKAPHIEKIKQLFNFFKDKQDNGIKFKDFTKMLFHYSRDELKEILMEDRLMISELNKTLTDNLHEKDITNLYECHSSISTFSTRGVHLDRIIELNYEQPKESQDESCFRKNYSKFSQYRDLGTIMELRLNDLTYKINFCNMITLVKEFARRTYKNYQIDIKTGIFTFEQFSEWMQSHNKLFQSYYTSFHIDIWSYFDQLPNFIHKVEKSFVGRMKIDDEMKPAFGMLVEDVLILAESRKEREKPFKVIFLEGLSLKQAEDQNGFGIEFTHRDEYYQKCTIYFMTQRQLFVYMEWFNIYSGQALHDLYYSHEVIGTGKFSIVYRCTQKQSGKSYALKDISTDKLTTQAISILNNQSEIMKIISHPQIVKYQQTIRSKAHIYIIAEYIEGKDLYQFVKERKHLSEYVSAFIIGKVIEAIIYLHSLEIMHRDLKPENIMVMLKKGTSKLQEQQEEYIENVKIIDFGLANHISELLTTRQKQGIVGTPNYIAPEIIIGEPPTFKSDIFSIGSILYFLLSGKLAFAYESTQYTLVRTAKGDYDLHSGIWESISPQAKDLIVKMLEPNPRIRIGLEEALNHVWFDVAKREICPKLVEQVQIGLGESSYEQKPSEVELLQMKSLHEISLSEYNQGQFPKIVTNSRR